jgi:hypothetical protein
MNHFAWKTPFALALSLTWGLGLARGTECPVGVKVNSFQNFSAVAKQVIVEQLKRSGVGCLRTSLRPDNKNMNLAENLQSEGIGLVLVPGVEFYPRGLFWYAWNEPHRNSIYRGGVLMEAGRLAVAPMPAH